MKHATIDDAPELAGLLANADHVDIKSIESPATLRQFTAAAFGPMPWWVSVLARARSVLARMLRLNHPEMPVSGPLKPGDVSFTPGHKVAFFTVVNGAADRFLILEATDKHLAGYLALLAKPVAAGHHRFRVVTIVTYRNWTGRLYFIIVRPAHHLVVRSMMRTGGRAC